MQISLNLVYLRSAGLAALLAGCAQAVDQNPSGVAAVSFDSGRPGSIVEISNSGEAAVRSGSSLGLSQFQQTRSSRNFTVRAQEPEKSCRIDLKTGCHYGHDEKRHPGGCRCDLP